MNLDSSTYTRRIFRAVCEFRKPESLPESVPYCAVFSMCPHDAIVRYGVLIQLILDCGARVECKKSSWSTPLLAPQSGACVGRSIEVSVPIGSCGKTRSDAVNESYLCLIQVWRELAFRGHDEDRLHARLHPLGVHMGDQLGDQVGDPVRTPSLVRGKDAGHGSVGGSAGIPDSLGHKPVNTSGRADGWPVHPAGPALVYIFPAYSSAPSVFNSFQGLYKFSHFFSACGTPLR